MRFLGIIMTWALLLAFTSFAVTCAKLSREHDLEVEQRQEQIKKQCKLKSRELNYRQNNFTYLCNDGIEYVIHEGN